MKKFCYSLLVLFMSITTAVFAQQEEAATIETWDGSDIGIELVRDGKNRTFEYIAPAAGKFYLYNDEHDPISTNVTLTLWGGLYKPDQEVYDSEVCLKDVADYFSGIGFYGWIEVAKGDVVRFTLVPEKTDSESSKSVIETLSLKSVFLDNSIASRGKTIARPVKLTANQETGLPVCTNKANYNNGINSDNVTYCSFEAGYSGIASISTMEYEIYYNEKGVQTYESVQSNNVDDEHLIPVEKGKTYIVAVPHNDEKLPTEVTFKMLYDRSHGACAEYPIEIIEFPETVNLVKGDNFFKFATELLGDKTMMEIAVAAGWTGFIEYYEGVNAGASAVLTTDKVSNADVIFYKNVDLGFVHSYESLIVNFYLEGEDIDNAAVLTLRQPTAGEAYSTANEAILGENSFSGPARDYWFKYTSIEDAEYRFESTGKIKHVCFDADSEMAGETFRVREGQTIYVCVASETTDAGKLTITSESIEEGDYCDKAISFVLGDNIAYIGRGVAHYRTFSAEKDGYAILVSTGWTIRFLEDCDGRPIYPIESSKEIPLNGNPGDDDYEYVIEYTYRLPIMARNSYIVEVNTTKESLDENIVITTKYEEPSEGDFYSTAIEIDSLEKRMSLTYEKEVTKWYKFTADNEGFYTIRAKLGLSGSLTAKLGDQNINAEQDNESSNNAYMGGYSKIKQYMKKDQVLYICTKTGKSNDESQFTAEYYFSVSFTGLRDGEESKNAVKAEPNISYPVMSSNPESLDYDANAYQKWYTYTIPAGKGMVISILSEAANYYRLTFKKEDLSSMFQAYGDFEETVVTNNDEVTLGRTYKFVATDVDRTFYIQVPVVTYAKQVYWKIEGDDTTGDDTTGDDTTGDDNTGDDNTGDDTTDDDTTGDDNTGDDTTGDDTTGDDTTGDDTTGDDNTGDDNTGDDNTGDDTTDDDTTGDDNTGDDTTGDDTTGDDNTGDDNTGDDNTGDDEEDNAVDVVEITDKAAIIYDLMGRRVMAPTKGIYIINGVKHIIK